MTAPAADVKENWEKTCAKCHGPDGKGQTKMGQKLGIKDYTDAKVQAEMKDEEAFKAIKEGLKDKEGKILMKPAEGLSDGDIKALVAHVRDVQKVIGPIQVARRHSRGCWWMVVRENGVRCRRQPKTNPTYAPISNASANRAIGRADPVHCRFVSGSSGAAHAQLRLANMAGIAATHWRRSRARTPRYAGRKSCDECHSDKVQQLAKAEHKTISCESCHGPGKAHADDPDMKLHILTDNECMRCHESNPSRPAFLKQIALKEHYRGERCISCHVPHQPTEVP